MLSTRNYVKPLKRLFNLLLFILPLFLSAQVPDDAYCIPEVHENPELYISNFYFNTINNPSGNDGYTYYSSIETPLIENGTSNFHITFSDPGLKYYKIWIDFGQNGSFEDGGEMIANGVTNDIEVSGTVTMPGTIPYGQTRIRVMVSRYPIITSCDNIEGEIEDYSAYHESVGDPDWDIVVTSGLHIYGNGHYSDCVNLVYNVSFIASSNCNGGAYNLPQNFHYNIEAIGPVPLTFNAQGPLAIMNTVPVTSNSMTIEIPLNISNTTPFIQGEDYDITFKNLVYDHDCNPNNPKDIIAERISFPRNCLSATERVESTSSTTEDTRLGGKAYEATATIQPNPFNNQFTLNYNLEKPETNLRISVHDLYGKQVMKQIELSNQAVGTYLQNIDASELQSGAYFLLIEGENFYQTEKLIKLQ